MSWPNSKAQREVQTICKLRMHNAANNRSKLIHAFVFNCLIICKDDGHCNLDPKEANNRKEIFCKKIGQKNRYRHLSGPPVNKETYFKKKWNRWRPYSKFSKDMSKWKFFGSLVLFWIERLKAQETRRDKNNRYFY